VNAQILLLRLQGETDSFLIQYCSASASSAQFDTALFNFTCLVRLGLFWFGLDWIGLDWIGLDWIGLDWID